MRELLKEIDLETIENYLIPLIKYVIRLNIWVEDQIKGRRAGWLLGVRKILRKKKRIYFLEGEEVISHEKIQKLNGEWVIKFYRRKKLYPEELQRKLDYLKKWEKRLLISLETIEAYMLHIKMELEIEYLDLAIPNIGIKIVKLEKFKHKCYFNNYKNSFHHSMHQENSQPNTIIDLLVSLGINLGKYHHNMINLNNQINTDLVARNRIINLLRCSIEYIKNENNDLIKPLGEIKKLTHKQEILDVINWT